MSKAGHFDVLERLTTGSSNLRSVSARAPPTKLKGGMRSGFNRYRISLYNAAQKKK